MPKTKQKSVMPPKQSKVEGLPEEVALIRAEIRKFFAKKDESGKRIGSYKHGVYAFYDYDGEPIYVGQTKEKLSGRVSRHLTNQRTDAVAMNVLDPFEVAYISVWPLDDQVDGLGKKDMKAFLDRAEYTVFQKVLKESALGAVLNEMRWHREVKSPCRLFTSTESSPNLFISIANILMCVLHAEQQQ
ncbi:MAG: GIY-YIG nuclease family protein [bacterium]